MHFMPLSPRLFFTFAIALLIACAGTSAAAHEAWLLTPAEIERLAIAPIPPLFQSWVWLGLAAVLGALLTSAALRAEDVIRPYEDVLAARVAPFALSICPAILRLGLATMLALAGLGGLPRHGTDVWSAPTLLVPDMQLGLVSGWDSLALVQIVIALWLVTGLFSRLAGLAVIGLALLGPAIFGPAFLSYTPHFAAPGLMLAIAGGGALSLDRLLRLDAAFELPAALRQSGWRLAQILVGGGFIYLAVAYKLTQPTLLIAILEHGNLPTFGIPLPIIALIMTWVEIICGALLVLGRLTRPVALVIIGAITVLAVGLAETPLFHANLYSVMIFLAVTGRHLPGPAPVATSLRRVQA